MRKGLVENLAEVSIRAVFRAYSSELTYLALQEGNVRGMLLVEEFSSEDANKLDAAVKEIRTLIATAADKFADASEVWSKPFGEFEAFMTDMPDAVEIVNLIQGGDADKLGKMTADYTKKLQTVAGDIAALIGAIGAVQKDLANFKDAVGENGAQTIGELAGQEGGEFPPLDKLDAGIQKAYQIPGWFDKIWASGSKAAEEESGGGFFKKAMAFIGGLFKSDKSGRVVDAGLIADAIKATPYDVFMGVDLSDVQTSLESATEVAGEETTQATAAAQTAAGGDDGVTDAGEGDADPSDDIEAAAKEPEAPGVAISNALDAWYDGLAAESQKTIKAKGRYDALKTGINDTLDGLSKTVEKEVGNAVGAWRKEHEESMGRRFSKKNMDALQSMIPKLASTMMQKKEESVGQFTVGTIHRAVYRYLDNTYRNDRILFESARWSRLAGIGEDDERC